ncbi:MAG: hypothetical protein V1921_06675 [Candidatus Altiarchaeota archaeon]
MTGTRIVKLKLEEDGSPEKLPQLMGDKTDEIVRVYRETGFDSFHYINYYNEMLRRTAKYNLTPKQLQNVVTVLELERSRSLDKYQPSAGLFITALIQNSGHDRFEFRVRERLSRLGHRLASGKEIIVDGDVENFTGESLQGGSITVDGSARECTGSSMRKGKILVKHSCENYTGSGMSGGSITVEGRAGDETGHEMKGGTIRVDYHVGDKTGQRMSGGLIDVGMTAGHDTGEKAFGGIIKVGGEIKGISPRFHGDELWENGEKIR